MLLLKLRLTKAKALEEAAKGRESKEKLPKLKLLRAGGKADSDKGIALLLNKLPLIALVKAKALGTVALMLELVALADKGNERLEGKLNKEALRLKDKAKGRLDNAKLALTAALNKDKEARLLKEGVKLLKGKEDKSREQDW